MPKRIPTCTVIVQRDGKNFKPPIGKPFEFSADEIDQVNRVMPHALRKPVNEEAAPVSQAPAPAPAQAATSSSRGKSNRSSSTSSTSSASDTEL